MLSSQDGLHFKYSNVFLWCSRAWNAIWRLLLKMESKFRLQNYFQSFIKLNINHCWGCLLYFCLLHFGWFKDCKKFGLIQSNKCDQGQFRTNCSIGSWNTGMAKWIEFSLRFSFQKIPFCYEQSHLDGPSIL